MQLWPQPVGQYGVDLCENSIGRLCHAGVAPRLRDVGAEEQRLQFLFVEHQRRDLIAAP